MDVNAVLLEEIEERFAKVLVGEMSRWDAYLWAQAQVLAERPRPYDGPIDAGLALLQGLAAVEVRPGVFEHRGDPGVMREWAVSDADAHRQFKVFRKAAADWRESPERELDAVTREAGTDALLAAEIDEIERNMRDEDGAG